MRARSLLLFGVLTAGALTAVQPAAGQFAFQQLDVPFEFNANPTSIGVGNLNQDGFLDLLVTGRNVDGVMLLLLGNAAGTFEPPVQLPVEAQSDWVEVRHLDQDSHLDLAIALRSGRGRAIVTKGNGDGTFGPIMTHFVQRQPSNLIARDLDGDQDLDLAVANWVSESVTILINDGNANYSAAQTIHLGQLTRGTAGSFYMTADDLDGDSDVDIAVALSSGYITLLINQGSAPFARPQNVPVIEDDGAPTGIASGDIDADGDIDIVFAELTLTGIPGNLVVLRNQGAGHFEGITRFAAADWVWYVALADLDGDNLLDATITDALAGKLVLFENLTTTPGELVLSSPQVIELGGFPRSVRPADLDGDCDLDLAVANIGSHTVHVLYNDTPQENPCPNQSSSRPPRSSSKAQPGVVQRRPSRPATALSDVTGDGRVTAQDLAVVLNRFESR